MFRRDIEGLRAVAVLSVLIFHFHGWLVPGGFTGVDIFFVISGYLITGSCVHDLDAGKFSIVRFYWKRARRIIPALTATILVATIGAYAILLPADLVDYSWSAIASATFWSNVYFWQTSNYFSPDAELRPLLHTWSLSVEEQFYIFMPVLISIIYRYLGRRWTIVLLPILVASFAASVVATYNAPTANFYLIVTRAWELLLGALLMLVKLPPARSTRVVEAVGLAGAGLLAYGLFGLQPSDSFPGVNAIYPCLGAALVIYAGDSHPDLKSQPIVSRLLSLSPMTFIGRISYSLYLVHWPLISLYRYKYLGDPGIWTGFAMFVASIGLAALSWRFIEQPFRQSGPWTGPKPILAGAAAALAGICAIGYVGLRGDGFPARYPDFAQVHIRATEDWRVGSCFNVGSNDLTQFTVAGCMRTSGYPVNAMLWGDSFAAHYSPGLEPNADRLGANVIQYTFAGCPPDLSYYSYARPACTRFNARALDIIRAEKISTVVLSARWTDYQNRGFAGLSETIARLQAMNVRVVLIGQSPQFAADIQKVAYAAKRKGDTSGKARLRMDPDINERVAAAAHGAEFINPLRSLCSGDMCPYREGDEFLYSDYGHLSAYGARLAIELYWPPLGSAPSN